jgi:hypothetical protein
MREVVELGPSTDSLSVLELIEVVHHDERGIILQHPPADPQGRGWPTPHRLSPGVDPPVEIVVSMGDFPLPLPFIQALISRSW